MELIYLCGCNPNDNSSINGDLPKVWLEQTITEINRLTLISAISIKNKKDWKGKLPSEHFIFTCKPKVINELIRSVEFERFLTETECSICIEYPKDTSYIIHGGCVSYLRQNDDVLFTIHYHQDETKAWLLRKV